MADQEPKRKDSVVTQERQSERGGARPSRRWFLGAALGMAGAYAAGLGTPRITAYLRERSIRRAVEAVLPEAPVRTGLTLGRPVAALIEAGTIDPARFRTAYADRGPLPPWVHAVLAGSDAEVVLSRANAPYLLNVLWPLGLANRAAFNADSPLNGPDAASFASTGGWTLGNGGNGADWFNAVDAVALAPEQDALVRSVADRTFRPCCDNSTFFQDCNHGSAMLGLLQLAAASGGGEDALFRLARDANGFWYPEKYVEMALYFDRFEGLDWRDVKPERTVSRAHASISGWRKTVHAAMIADTPSGGTRAGGGGSGCAV